MSAAYPESATEPDGYEPAARCAFGDCVHDARVNQDGVLYCRAHATRDFATDRAAAALYGIEEGCLRGLASLPYHPPAADLAEFVAGFCHVPSVSAAVVLEALFALDALGWVMPEGGIPRRDGAWFITEQGRIALEARP